MNAALSMAQWVVGKALAPLTDGILEKWEASKNLGLNIEALKMELLLVKATLETAGHKQLPGPSMETLLQKLRDSAQDAEDLLDKLDYFRIHDELQGTNDAADEHAKGGAHNLAFNARHTVKAFGKPACLSTCWPAVSPAYPGQEDARQRVGCCAWLGARQRARGYSSSAPNANQVDEVSRCMPKLGKFLPGSPSQHAHGDDSDKATTGAPQKNNENETPNLGFDRVGVSARMKEILEQLQPVRTAVTTILQSCGPSIVSNFAHSRPITTGQSIESKLYGRDRIMNTIIHDITKGKYCRKDLNVLPIVGPGGIGKTTLIQHIYHSQDVQNHFQVKIWICVSLSFNLNKMLEEIKKNLCRVEGEKEGTTEDLIEQRLKSKRFLLVLDDIWECSNEDDWKRLLLPLKASQQNGSTILVTTRFPAIAQMVKTTNSIEVEGLETEEFRKLFFAFVFGDEQCRRDHISLLRTGDKIMEKLKGSPLAAKTVGRLLRNDLNLRHWRKVLESKEWEAQTGVNDIIPALKLSYDYLPFHQQQCFSYSALFPEDYEYSSSQLINLWIGLDILKPDGQNKRMEDIGLSNLNDLVTHGFFREEETNGRPVYVMHDLLHDLALKVASHECLSLHHSNVGSVEIEPSIHHLSIIIGDVGDDNADQNFKSELRRLKTRLKVEHLQTLMLFGGLDESFGRIFCDLFREANALRVIHLPNMKCPVESMLHNFSALVHLRYLCLGIYYSSEMNLPSDITRFYHLRILDIELWHDDCGFPEDMSNLTKLCHFITPNDELHSDICNVGKLVLLEELKVFKVNKESEGYEPKQLENLTQLREIGMYNLENIQTKEDASAAKLIEKRYLERLTLNWDRERVNIEPDLEAVVLENLQPPRNLQVLSIRGNGGPSCPTWLGDDLAVEALQSLHLIGVSWETFPSFGKMRDLRELVLKHIDTMKEFVIEQSFCRLRRLELVSLGTFEKWVQGAAHPFPLLQELIIRDCPKLLELFVIEQSFSRLTRLKFVDLGSFEKWVKGDAHLFPVLQVLIIRNCPKLSELPVPDPIAYPPDKNWDIDWFPKLQELEILDCPELLLVIHISGTKSLRSVKIRDVKLLRKFEYYSNSFEYYSNSSEGILLNIAGKDDLHSLDEVLVFNKETGLENLTLEKCPPLELKHLLMLTSLKTLVVESSDALVGPLGGRGDVEWQLPVEQLMVNRLRGASVKELTELLTHLPKLCKLEIFQCENITQLVVGLDLQQTKSATTAAADSEVEQEKEEDGLLLFPPHLSDSLRVLLIDNCPRLVPVDQSTFLPHRGGHGNTKTERRRGGLQAMRSLQKCTIWGCPMFLSACLSSSPSLHLFPSSLQSLTLNDLEGMGTLEPLSNLTSLTSLYLWNCGEDLRCEGLGPLLTTGGQLSKLIVLPSPRFFAGWDPNPRRVLQDEGGEKKQQLQLVPSPPSSSKLQELRTDDAVGFLAAPICSLLSSSLILLNLQGTEEMMERFSKEQEDALHLLASLQELEFGFFVKLQHLPAGLHKLTNLKKLVVYPCPAVRSLPEDGLPKSLQYLDVSRCDNEELKQQCRGLVGAIPKIKVD